MWLQATGHSALYAIVPLIAMVEAVSGSMVGGVSLIGERTDGLLSRLWDFGGLAVPGRAAVLSPLDRLVYDRKRMVELFEFDYQLEMYKPAAQRRWGYYTLPILYGDRLVGKVDATAHRKAGVLQVDTIHQDVPFSATMSAAVRREITDLAHWLELDLALPH